MTCGRCDEKITKGALKVGVVTEGSWGPSTQWHHMQCTVFQVATPEEVEGYNDLEDAVQVRETSLPVRWLSRVARFMPFWPVASQGLIGRLHVRMS